MYFKKAILFVQILLLAALFFTGFCQKADAIAPCKDSAGADVQGFTVALVYCVRSTITDALTGSHTTNIVKSTGYLPLIVTFLSPLKWAAITLAIVLFGMKLLTLDVEEVLKEGSGLLFRIAIVLFLIETLTSKSFYNSGTGAFGLYAAAVDSAGDLAGIVSVGFQQLASVCIAQSPPLPAGVNQAEYATWQALDCMFQGMMGVASNPAVIGASMVVILGAALWTGTLGIYIILIAVTLFIMALVSLMRALYVYMLSFFIIGLLMAIAPLIIPFKVFDNRYVSEIFWKWVTLVSSTIIQPMFIVGFLSFVVLVENQFVNGNLPTCTTASACSFSQIMQNCQQGNCISYQPLFHLKLNIQFPQQTCNGNIFQNIVCGIGNLVTDVVNWTVDQMNKVLGLLDNIILHVPTLTSVVLKQLFVSISAFLLITVAFRSLMDTVPEMAKQICQAVGTGMLLVAQIPLEKAVASAVKSGGEGMKLAASSAKSGGSSNLGAFGKGLAGGGKGVIDSIKRSVIK